MTAEKDPRDWLSAMAKRRITAVEISEILDVSRTTANSRISKGISADDLVAICRGLSINPVEGLVELGYLTYPEVMSFMDIDGQLLDTAQLEELFKPPLYQRKRWWEGVSCFWPLSRLRRFGAVCGGACRGIVVDFVSTRGPRRKCAGGRSHAGARMRQGQVGAGCRASGQCDLKHISTFIAPPTRHVPPMRLL